MKGGTVQISWHGKDPVFSVDFHRPTGLLATAGADRDIKLWSLHRQDKSIALPSATFKASLSYHNGAVNVIRFSPSGKLLASGGDYGELLIWTITQSGEETPSWKVWKTLRSHQKDVLDLGWSPDDTYLVSGSVDNTCIIWNVLKGSVEQVLEDHRHYVQGVTWDPSGIYLASLSGDRTCRIYSPQFSSKRSKGKDKLVRRMYSCQNVLCKADALLASPNFAAGATVSEEASHKQASCAKQYLFHDENMRSFFRRLSWSPDGSFLLLPAGVEKDSPEASSYSVSYVVSRKDLSRPAIQLPAGSKPVVASRFCPVKYACSPSTSWKHDTGLPGLGAFRLPYRIIFAVATLNSVYIYNTEQSCPIAVFGGLHFAPITDLAWSSDAKFLAVSSEDGFCSLVGFDEGDLGTPIPENWTKDNNLMQDSQIRCSQIRWSQVKFGQKDEAERRPDSWTSDISGIRQNRPPSPKEASVSETEHPSIVSSGGSDIKDSVSSASRCSPDAAEGHSQKFKSPGEPLSCSALGVERLVEAQQFPRTSDTRIEDPKICPPLCKDAQLLQPPSTSTYANSNICIPAESHELNSWKNDLLPAECPQGPATPHCSEHLHSNGANPLISQESRDHYSDIYVRPLKFKRISPRIVSEDPEQQQVLNHSLANR